MIHRLWKDPNKLGFITISASSTYTSSPWRKQEKFQACDLKIDFDKQPSRAACRTENTTALRTLAMATQNSSRRSLQWKDSKLKFPKSVKLSAHSNGWISLGDSRTEALSEFDGTSR